MPVFRQSNAAIPKLVPNSTHLTQPLDVSVFRPAKIHWKNILIRWRKESKTGGYIPKSHLHFPCYCCLLYQSVYSIVLGKFKIWVSCYWHITTRSKPGFKTIAINHERRQE